MTLARKLWIAIGVLIVLSPSGLILPVYFKVGTAWGEWGQKQLREMTGYVPQGFQRLSVLWKAPLGDYTFQGWGGKDMFHLSVAYVISAMVGIAVIVGVVLLIGKVLVKEKE